MGALVQCFTRKQQYPLLKRLKYEQNILAIESCVTILNDLLPLFHFPALHLNSLVGYQYSSTQLNPGKHSQISTMKIGCDARGLLDSKTCIDVGRRCLGKDRSVRKANQLMLTLRISSVIPPCLSFALLLLRMGLTCLWDRTYPRQLMEESRPLKCQIWWIFYVNRLLECKGNGRYGAGEFQLVCFSQSKTPSPRASSQL